MPIQYRRGRFPWEAAAFAPQAAIPQVAPRLPAVQPWSSEQDFPPPGVAPPYSHESAAADLPNDLRNRNPSLMSGFPSDEGGKFSPPPMRYTGPPVTENTQFEDVSPAPPPMMPVHESQFAATSPSVNVAPEAQKAKSNYPPRPQMEKYQERLNQGPRPWRQNKLGNIAAAALGFGAGYMNASGKNIPYIDVKPRQAEWRRRAQGGGSYDEKLAQQKELAGMEAAEEKRGMDWETHQANLKKVESETVSNYGRDDYYRHLIGIESKKAANQEEKELFDSTVTPWGPKDTDIIVLNPGDTEPPSGEGWKIVPSPFSRYPNVRYAIRKSLGFAISEEEAKDASAVQRGPDGKPYVKDYRQITEPMRVRLATAERQLDRAMRESQNQVLNSLNYLRYDLQKSNAAARAGTASATDARERARILQQALQTKNKGIADAREILDEKLAMYRPDTPEYKRAVRDFKEAVTNLLNAYSDVTEKPLEVIGDDLEIHAAPRTGRELLEQVLPEMRNK